jgi:hypothetical protein
MLAACENPQASSGALVAAPGKGRNVNGIGRPYLAAPRSLSDLG